MDVSNHSAAKDINNIDFNTYKSERHSNSVQFILFESGIVVVKPNVALLEYNASRVANMMNVLTPSCRMMTYDEIHTFWSAVGNVQYKQMKTYFGDSITEEQEIEIQGYVDQYRKYWNDALLMEYIEDVPGVIDEVRMLDIARLVLFDLMITNLDRFPVWNRLLYPELEHEPNPGNFIFSADGRVYAIDQIIKCGLVPKGDLDSYFERFEKVALDFHEKGENSGLVTVVVDYLRELGSDMMDHSEMMLFQCYQKVLEEWEDLTIEQFEDMWHQNEQSVDFQFIFKSLSILRNPNNSQ
eukprot:TRINITY_DN5780_c0_g1_i2.p1 TRINITY_DN5780_c0_g1~~TRINITY_DN5780_c0_g1_i2.p1  ORF type:complete len:297 (-),score=60.45 TRINITY_DN5780_c0_g1_i2:16-906(-)